MPKLVRPVLVSTVFVMSLVAVATPASAGPLDGRIVFSDVFLTPGIYTIAPDGTAKETVVDGGGVYRPKWLPDASAISFIAEVSQRRTRLDVVDADGSNRTALISPSELPEERRLISTYDWSPDGTRVALCLFGNDSASYLADADGSNLTLLLADGCVYDWTPQDRILARRGRTLILMDPDGSNRDRLRPGIDVHDPAVSPDGSRIAFMCGPYEHVDICTIGTDGTGLVNLTGSNRMDWSPGWSPDGSRIVWTPTTNTPSQAADLWRMRADGSNKTRLTDTPNIDEYEPDWTILA